MGFFFSSNVLKTRTSKAEVENTRKVGSVEQGNGKFGNRTEKLTKPKRGINKKTWPMRERKREQN